MLKFNELAKIAKDAGFDVNMMGNTQMSVDEPHSHRTTPHDFVMFEDIFGWAIPKLATTKTFENKVLKAVRFY